MYTRSTWFFPDQYEGLAFTLRDLNAALTWAETKAEVRLHIKLDCVCMSEIIEIYPPGASLPRWCLWRTHEGRLQVDDLEMDEFALPYPTVDMALRFIASTLVIR
jgi:hypothetical protein